MTSLKIKDYTIEELLQFANIYDKRIEDVEKKEIKAGINQRIVRSMQLQKTDYTNFFHKVKEVLFKMIEMLKKRENEAEEEDEHDEGWTEPYKEKVENPIEEEAKSRSSSTKLLDKEHSAVTKMPFSPELEVSKLDYSTGTLNKLFRQKSFYSLVVNSQHRKLIQYPNPDIDLIKSGEIGRCATLEEVFTENPKAYVEPENNFTVTLSTPMKRVTKLKVSQIEIPISWYAFRKCDGTTCIKMGPTTTLGEIYYPIDAVANYTKLVRIEEGNYAEQELIQNLQQQMIGLFGLDPSHNPNYNIMYSISTKKTTIYTTNHPDSPFNKNFNLFFYLEKTPAIAANYMQNSPKIPAITQMILDPTCNSCSSNNIMPKVDYNLGWLLGFRGARYTGQTSYTSEATINTYGPRTIGIEINDFTNNSSSNTVVTIKEEGDTFGRPSGIEDCEPAIPVGGGEDTSRADQGLRLLSCRPPRNAEHPDKTSSGDLIQSTTKNKFFAKQQEKRVWKPIVNRSRPYGNSFARLQVKKLEGDIIFAEPSDQRSEKNYFGPVTISRLKFKLLDDRGEYLDLIGQQWSIKIDAESIYQY